MSPAAQRVASRYLRAATQAVDEKFVEQLRKDVLLLLKNVPRVTDEASYEKFRQGVQVWRKHFSAVIFERWLNNLPVGLDPSFKHHLDKKVRTLAWDLYIDMDFLSIKWWETARLKQWGQRVQRKASALWKELKLSIKNYNNYHKTRSNDAELVTEVETRENHVLAGFTIQVKGMDSDDPFHWEMLGRIEDALKAYRQRASQVMPLLLKKQTPMVLDYNAHIDKGGEYFSYERGLIMINPSATVGQVDNKRAVKTLAHEMGHHLFQVAISGEARRDWETTIHGDFDPLRLVDLLKQWPESIEWAHDFVEYMAPKDSILALQVEAITQEHKGLGKREEFVELSESTPTVNVPKTPITGYATKNPEEAFCEVIGLLVAYGPRAVHERIRRLIQAILPGQIKLAQVVAGRYLQADAEVLTKEWVMGVRRGWLSLMKPRISDYASVLRAHDALDQFVEGLRDQIKYVRRGPATRQTGKLWPKINAQFEKLLEAINDSKNKAQHWKDHIDGRALSQQWGEDRSEDARKMLELYKSNFADATGTTVKLRGERWKGVDLTHLMDQILKLLREDAKNLTEWGLDKPPESVYKEFDLHGMKIVMDDSTLLPSEIKDYIKYFDEAYQRLKQKGFGKVWYGTLFVKCKDCGGTNQYGPELGVGGNYPIGPDKVNVFSRPSKYIVELVAHELGHRYWFKLMSSTQRERFKDLIEIKKRPPNYEPKLYTTADAQAAKAGVEAAYEPLRKDLKAFGSSKVKWWPNLLKKFEEPLIKAGHNTMRDLIPVLSKVWPNASLPEVKGLHTDALEANGVLTKALFHMDQTIKGEIHALPEPATAPEDLDAYWAGIFKPIQKKWIDDILQKVDAAVATAYIYIDAAVQANNEAEQEIAVRLQRNWEEQSKELAKRVPPVSDYGEKHIDEAFAEVFAYYIMGKNMTQDQIESFKAVVKTATASKVASRYLVAQKISQRYLAGVLPRHEKRLHCRA